MNFCSVGYRNDGGTAHPMPTVVLHEEHVGIRIPGSRAGAKASAATTAEQHPEAVLGLAGASGPSDVLNGVIVRVRTTDAKVRFCSLNATGVRSTSPSSSTICPQRSRSASVSITYSETNREGRSATISSATAQLPAERTMRAVCVSSSSRNTSTNRCRSFSFSFNSNSSLWLARKRSMTCSRVVMPTR
jgi:hypothetical protein